MSNKEFCIFILTHGRPNKVITYRNLIKANCTYPIYFILDNEDSTYNEYVTNFGKDKVIVFDKLEISKTFDTGDNSSNRKTIVYARNACFGIAEKLGYKYFLELDDDYSSFDYRFDSDSKYVTKRIKEIDTVFEAILEFYKNINAKSVAFLQGGDMIGGDESSNAKKIELSRKAMNTFFCSTERRFDFLGRINEDVNTYVGYQSKGNLFLSINNITITQLTTQTNAGGMTEVYLETGTYMKSFFTVMYAPSCTKIRIMGQSSKRLHHSISWDNAVPKILSEDLKKK
jgi:hypothetical protein